jgi:hypothetical protein
VYCRRLHWPRMRQVANIPLPRISIKVKWATSFVPYYLTYTSINVRIGLRRHLHCIPKSSELKYKNVQSSIVRMGLFIMTQLNIAVTMVLTRLSLEYPFPVFRCGSKYIIDRPDRSFLGSGKYTPASIAAKSSLSASLNVIGRTYLSLPKTSRRPSQYRTKRSAASCSKKRTR